MQRRSLIASMPFVLLLSAPALRAQSDPQRLPAVVVMEFDFVDDQKNPATVDAQTRRLRDAYVQLQRELAERGLYRVLDPAPVGALQRRLREQQEFMYRCDDCAHQVGVAAGADLVITAWVQKVSELILNVNLQVHDVAGQKLLLSKSVDMRSNDDVSWSRAVRYLVRDMAEKRAANPRYGR
ncbi:DUF3280 domain-containing protein [uncultured Methylibium sp.]|uniref:DUF3280 domain-containing protein n=1 Tax=uncultured Methylibium sp. TaxID=381093 RepID=UPI0026002C67|nr:DUF3280 domain-containing protein [uncultured Methylibium sp.]